MAPTNANATYATAMVSLVTNGPVKVIEESSLVHVAARSTNEHNHPFPAEKSAALSLRHFAALPNVVKES